MPDTVANNPRKTALRSHADRSAPEREAWTARNRFFHDEDLRYMRFLIPSGLRVLELGCGIGDLLAGLEPSHGVGIDFSEPMIERARARHPGLTFHVGDVEDPAQIAALDGPFDAIVLSDTVGMLEDIEATLGLLHSHCGPDTRIVVAYYSTWWEPVLRLAELLGQRMPQPDMNFLSTADIMNLMALAGFEPIKREWRQLLPKHLFGLGPLVNRFIGTLPLLRQLCLRNYVVGRSLSSATAGAPRSVSVVVPCRNERGNVEPAVQRLPRFADDMEIIFVEGHSKDGTWEEIQRVQAAYPQYDIKAMRQDGIGKADAVFKAFDAARGDVLMILDADLTVPPEQLPKFWQPMAAGRAEFVNGTRLVYPMEQEAMRFLNLLANRIFSMLFTWLLNQRFTDTLCGTKVISRANYLKLKANRSYFGDFDPFGDFDLIFGASKMNLKIVEVPIRYQARSYGETQISRFRHGWMLLKMVVFAFRKLKAF